MGRRTSSTCSSPRSASCHGPSCLPSRASRTSPGPPSTPPSGTTTSTSPASAWRWWARAPAPSSSCLRWPSRPARSRSSSARRATSCPSRTARSPAGTPPPSGSSGPLFWLFGEQFSRGLDDSSKVGRLQQAVALRHLGSKIKDPDLRARLTPDYPIGCKRILFSNNYYPTLTLPHVHVETTAIERITATGLVTADGVEHPADVIVYGTGFDSQDFLSSIDITGRNGQKLADPVDRRGASLRGHLRAELPQPVAVRTAPTPTWAAGRSSTCSRRRLGTCARRSIA